MKVFTSGVKNNVSRHCKRDATSQRITRVGVICMEKIEGLLNVHGIREVKDGHSTTSSRLRNQSACRTGHREL